MKTNLLITLCVFFLLVIIGLSIWWDISVWSECRTQNGFSYCLRLLAR